MPDWLKDLLDKFARQSSYMLVHACTAALFALLGFAVDQLLDWLGDPKLFDAVPWRYVVDVMDLVLVIVFVIATVSETVRVFRGE